MHYSTLLFVLIFPCFIEAAVEEVSIINDNYCDLADGSDEYLTSACAGVLGSPGFFCSGSGLLNITIPSSRVQDGVCDCCDGEDEVGSLFFPPGSTPCPQSCSERMVTLKAETLASYKHISAGLRAKNDLVNVLNRKKLREKQSYDGLLHEYSEIQKLYYKIKYWLERDSRVEGKLMFAELRSRVRQCAAGFFEACDYFHDGSNTMYPQSSREELLYDFPELWDEQGPLPDTPPGEDDLEEGEGEGEAPGESMSRVGSLDPSKVGNSLHRKKLDTVSEKIEEVIRKNQARDRVHAQLSGPQRIENSFCAFEEMDTVGLLGGEESLRVHKNVKQYLDWVSGKGGIAARKLSVEQTRRKSTLFGAYLDSGGSGNDVGLQVLFEMVGMALAPLTVSYTELTRRYYDGKKALFRRAQTCVLEQSGDLDLLDTLPGKRGEGGEDGSEYLPCDGVLVWFYRVLLELSREASPVSVVLRYLDYNNYDWIMTRVVTRVTPYINSNMWYFRIIQQTPYYYYRYYFGDGASKLPVYRNACTLREGLRVAMIEAEDMRAKIEAKKQQVEAEGGEVEASVGADGRLSSTGSAGGSLLSSFQSSSNNPTTPDFGPDGSWQVLNDTCLSRHEGEYVYKVCAFQEVFQDRTKLGRFSHWGDKPLEGVEASPAESKMMSFKNKIRNKSDKKGGVKAATDYLADLVKGSTADSSQQGSGEVSYTKQFYGGGTACHNGIIRHAVVEFKCASFSEIVDVVEYEMCGYEIVVNTPIACTRDMEEAVLRRLQQLDVYGFGSEGKKKGEASGVGASAAVDSDMATSTAAPQKKSATVLSQEYKQKKQSAAMREQEESKAQEKEVEKEKVAIEVEVDAQGQRGATAAGDVKVVPVQDLAEEKAKAQAGKRGRRDPSGKQQGPKKPYRVTFNE